LTVTSADGTKPGIIVSKSSDLGDFAVPDGQAVSIGHWKSTAPVSFTERIRISSAGHTTIGGRTTLSIQDGIDFYDGSTFRTRLRASTAAARLVVDAALNVDGLFTPAAGLNMSGGDMTLTITNNATSTNSEPMRITTSTAHPLGVNRLVFRGTSSREYKTEISPLPDSDEILNNQPVTFHDKLAREKLGEDSVLQIGMIAEDFSETGPISNFYTVRDENNKITGIQYDLLSTALISAGRTLRSRIEALEARVAELEA
jgi:hypothetical protein